MKTKTASCLLFFALLTSAALAQENKSDSAAPQARPRLIRANLTDPAVAGPMSTAAPTPGATVSADPANKDAAPAPFVMERFVVKDKANLSLERRDAPERLGPFTPLEGGRFMGTRSDPFIVEVGLWAPTDVMAKDDTFKPAKTQVELGAVRIRW
jgi:hypothetical protein